MKRSPIFLNIFVALVIFLAGAEIVSAQSTSQEFPTAVVASEISGVIKARDVGDSRLTTYFYTFGSDQGDLFINIVTKNLTGDIDVFTVNGVRPLTKIVVYADYAEAETGRAIYLRKSEKLLLRIQGRTPNDDPATFRLKFAGSFVAVRAEDQQMAPELPKVSSESRDGIRVNSVGTLLPPPPKSVETPVEKEVANVELPVKNDESVKETAEEKPSEDAETKAKANLELVVTDPIKAEEKPEAPTPANAATTRRRTTANRRSRSKVVETEPKAKESIAVESAEPEKSSVKEAAPVPTLLGKRKSKAPKRPAEVKPDPLESISLVIQLKDGNAIQKKMSEVFKFSVDKGVLTVILKDGSISRYQIVNVAKVTIE